MEFLSLKGGCRGSSESKLVKMSNCWKSHVMAQIIFCREWKLTTVDPQERSTWRSGVRSAMRAASQLPGKGPTDVDVAPAPARLSKILL